MDSETLTSLIKRFWELRGLNRVNSIICSEETNYVCLHEKSLKWSSQYSASQESETVRTHSTFAYFEWNRKKKLELIFKKGMIIYASPFWNSTDNEKKSSLWESNFNLLETHRKLTQSQIYREKVIQNFYTLFSEKQFIFLNNKVNAIGKHFSYNQA